MTTPTPVLRPRYQVPPPPVVPAKRFSLLSAAQVVDEGGTLWQEGVEYYSDACNLETGFVDGWCPPVPVDEHGNELEKAIESFSPVKVTADPFTITSGIACQSPVFAAIDQARRLLERGEDLQVERQFWRQQMCRTDVHLVGKDKVLGLDDLIALIESHAAAHYAGQLFIHVPVRALVYLKQYRTSDQYGPLWRTGYGSVIVPGAGYVGLGGPNTAGPGEPCKPEPPPGDDDPWFWVLATGQVQIRRSDTFAHEAFDTKKNRRGAIAERTYVISADCYAAAGKADPCGCTPTSSGGSS
ncbi:hypothetical protein ACMATS_06075 [Streptoverticillium reticulum]|uniref:hypothetical protein n=1 Tax=Streptoverticillium reticulum TaxID=1433415 RepID=UPI0039BF6962